jgi:hypothetical protein
MQQHLFPIQENPEAVQRRLQRRKEVQTAAIASTPNPSLTSDDIRKIFDAPSPAGSPSEIMQWTLVDILADPNRKPNQSITRKTFVVACLAKLEILENNPNDYLKYFDQMQDKRNILDARNLNTRTKTASFNLAAMLRRKKREKSQAGKMAPYGVGKDWHKHRKLDTQLYPSERYVQASDWFNPWEDKRPPTDRDLAEAGIEFYEDSLGDKHIKTRDGRRGSPKCEEDRQELLDHQNELSKKASHWPERAAKISHWKPVPLNQRDGVPGRAANASTLLVSAPDVFYLAGSQEPGATVWLIYCHDGSFLDSSESENVGPTIKDALRWAAQKIK